MINPFTNLFTPSGCRWIHNDHGWALVDSVGRRLTIYFNPGFLAGHYRVLHFGQWHTAANVMQRELQYAVRGRR